MGKGQRPVVGTELIARAKEAADRPIVAIGGINQHNAAEVVRAGRGLHLRRRSRDPGRRSAEGG